MSLPLALLLAHVSPPEAAVCVLCVPIHTAHRARPKAFSNGHSPPRTWGDSAHGSEELLSSPVCHFWNRKLFLKERDILILRHITLQNVFERCHISSVKGPELFTRNSACFAGCRLGPGVDGRKSEGRGSPPQGLGMGTTSSRCTGHTCPLPVPCWGSLDFAKCSPYMGSSDFHDRTSL